MAITYATSSAFAGQVREKLAAKSSLNAKEKKLLGIIDGPNTLRKKRQLARMERRARNELGIGENEAIDWSAIDWAAVFKTILEVLLKLLPLLLLI